jgi:hypothetical protein
VDGIISVGGRGKNAAFYAAFLERGTGVFGPKGRSYIIKAKNRKALGIPGIGPRATATVQGIRPRLFVKQAQNRAMAQALRAFEDEFNSQLKRVSSIFKI